MPEVFPHYSTPHTVDGFVMSVDFDSEREFTCVASFLIPTPILRRSEKEGAELVFAARSRICRMGINLIPTGAITIRGGRARLTLRGTLPLNDVEIGRFFRGCFAPGVAVGRLVLCERGSRLGKQEVLRALARSEVRLPSPFSLDPDGAIHFQGQACVYRFRFHLRQEHVLAVLLRPDGKEILNFLQVRVAVPNVVLGPGEVGITSCAMFLQKHFLVLETGDRGCGQHLHARVLDPLETRTSNVYLEFENAGKEPVINPKAVGFLYSADVNPVEEGSHRFFVSKRRPPQSPEKEYKEFDGCIENIARETSSRCKFDRPMACQAGAAPFALKKLSLRRLDEHDGVRPAKEREPVQISLDRPFDLKAWQAKLPKGPVTVFCEYFPNSTEHAALLQLAVRGQLRGLAFRTASLTRGQFFSERDLVRMMDYAEFGVGLFWCNALFQHVAHYVQKDRRGFFVAPDSIAQFQDAMVVAIYGSTMDLPKRQAKKLAALIKKLKDFFGGKIALLTGGGRGVMELVLETGRDLELVVGSNFLENADQHVDADVVFYQSFQSTARHMRQRWFEIARFHLFCIGGVGTLEEIGLTLTDMKLGLVNTDPVVFFGADGNHKYWQSLADQLRLISEEKRGPGWLNNHILVTDNPDEVLDFYRRILEIA